MDAYSAALGAEQNLLSEEGTMRLQTEDPEMETGTALEGPVRPDCWDNQDKMAVDHQAWTVENQDQGEKQILQVIQKSYSVEEVPLVAVGEKTMEAISDLQEFEVVVAH